MKQRFITAGVLIALALPSLWFLNGVIFKVLVTFAGLMTIAEVMEAACVDPNRLEEGYTLVLEVAVAALGTLALIRLQPWTIFLVLCSVCLCDSFALFTGKLFGRNAKSHPFPKLSPHKTYQGLIGGVICSWALTALVLIIAHQVQHRDITTLEWLILLVGPVCAILGDLLGSATKRALGVKDSGERLRNYRFFRWPERIVGGHGGYLDRLDSIVFTAFVVGLLAKLTDRF